MYYDRVVDTIKYIKNEKNNIIGIFIIIVVYVSYLFIDFINNVCIIFPFLPFIFKKGPNSIKDNRDFSTYFIDLYIIALFSISFFGYFKTNNYFDVFFCSFFIWQILRINIFCLREILNISIAKIPIISFPRTFGALVINFANIIISFSFLYHYFNLVDNENKFKTIIRNMLFFTSLDFKISYECSIQRWICFFQIITFFIFVLVFITNIANLRRKRG